MIGTMIWYLNVEREMSLRKDLESLVLSTGWYDEI